MNNISKTLALSILVIFAFPISSSAVCKDKLTRTIMPGMKGADVKILQMFLNDNPLTQIAQEGVNSKGKESGVYDKATVRAFRTFQSINTEYILKPAGLKLPNGIVGKYARGIINEGLCLDEEAALVKISPAIEKKNIDKANDYIKKLGEMTRALEEKKKNNPLDALNSKLEALDNKINSALKNTMTMEGLAKDISEKALSNSNKSGDLTIDVLLPDSIKQGDKLYILGSNVTNSNTVYIGSRPFPAIRENANDKFISVVIPKDFAIGEYDVYVKSTNGVSNKARLSIRANNGDSTSKVQILSISPTKGNIGTEVVINGFGFTKNNTINTTTMAHTNVVSVDGKTLKFKITADVVTLDSGGKLSNNLPFSIFVRNENGDSNMINLKLE